MSQYIEFVRSKVPCSGYEKTKIELESCNKIVIEFESTDKYFDDGGFVCEKGLTFLDGEAQVHLERLHDCERVIYEKDPLFD